MKTWHKSKGIWDILPGIAPGVRVEAFRLACNQGDYYNVFDIGMYIGINHPECIARLCDSLSRMRDNAFSDDKEFERHDTLIYNLLMDGLVTITDHPEVLDAIKSAIKMCVCRRDWHDWISALDRLGCESIIDAIDGIHPALDEYLRGSL